MVKARMDGLRETQPMPGARIASGPGIEFWTISFHPHRRFQILENHLRRSGPIRLVIADSIRNVDQSGIRSV